MQSISVLLTGGPGAGKSSALATLRDRLSKRGFQVLVVPENATPLLSNSGGYEPAWHGAQEHVELQRIFLQYQIDQEKAYRRIAGLRPEKPYVLLHDRGCLDGRLFCTDEQWPQVLAGVGTTEAELLKHYDLVIHMTTCAAGTTSALYDYGPGSTNPSRYHNPEQAINADKLAQKIYSAHQQVRVVPNFSNFTEKIETVVSYVTEAVHCEGVVAGASRERMLMPCQQGRFPEEINNEWPSSVSREIFEIQITFLDATRTESVRLRRALRPKASGVEEGALAAADLSAEESMALYEYRHDHIINELPFCARRVLGAEAYHLMRNKSKEDSIEVQKRSVCFTWEGHYFELCSYAHADGAPLHSDWSFHGHYVLDKPKGAPVPPWLQSQEESVPEGRSGSTPTPTRTSPKLRRHATYEAAAEIMGRKTRSRSRSRSPKPLRMSKSRLECLLASPSLSKAAAVVARREEDAHHTQDGARVSKVAAVAVEV